MSPIELFWTAKKEANGEKLWDLDDTPGKLQRYIPQKNGDPSYNMFTLRANAFFVVVAKESKRIQFVQYSMISSIFRLKRYLQFSPPYRPDLYLSFLHL